MKIDTNDLDALDAVLRELVARFDGPILLVTFGDAGEYAQIHAGLPTQDRETYLLQAMEALRELLSGELTLLRLSVERKPRLQ